jgi:hypothetical protein
MSLSRVRAIVELEFCAPKAKQPSCANYAAVTIDYVYAIMQESKLVVMSTYFGWMVIE